MSKRKKSAPVIDSDSEASDSGSNLDEVGTIHCPTSHNWLLQIKTNYFFFIL